MEEIWRDSREVGAGDEGCIGKDGSELNNVGGKGRISSCSRAERVGAEEARKLWTGTLSAHRPIGPIMFRSACLSAHFFYQAPAERAPITPTATLPALHTCQVNQPPAKCRLKSSKISTGPAMKQLISPPYAKIASPTTRTFRCSRRITALNVKYAPAHLPYSAGRQIVLRVRRERIYALRARA